jgi:hypothetical protein
MNSATATISGTMRLYGTVDPAVSRGLTGGYEG